MIITITAKIDKGFKLTTKEIDLAVDTLMTGKIINEDIIRIKEGRCIFYRDGMSLVLEI